MNRPLTAFQCGPECRCEHVRDAVWGGDEPCTLGYRPSHADLVNLLGGSLAEAVLCRAPDDVDHWRFHVVCHGEAGYGVGVAWGREHRYSRLAGDATVRVGHVYGGLFVAGVDEP
ncbi:MAG: hypothetical protein OTJ97_11245, partial [SAR202 cluster bacterium]|nr:hypothetical protein [SAR202 cluster bacterium]